LDATFPKRWIGRDGPTPWSPLSPDITPPDFFKDKVYSTPVPDTDTLKARIRGCFSAVTEEMLAKTRREIEYRLDVPRAANGTYAVAYYCSTKNFLS
jgi:hypothetical protein